MSGSLNDLEYTFYWSGQPNGESREAGAGFAIKRDNADRNDTSSEGQDYDYENSSDRNATIVSAYPRGEQGDIL